MLIQTHRSDCAPAVEIWVIDYAGTHDSVVYSFYKFVFILRNWADCNWGWLIIEGDSCLKL